MRMIKIATLICLPVLALFVLILPATAAFLTFIGMYKDGVNGVDGLYGIRAVLPSPDGAYIYTAASTDRAVSVFSRNPATGLLTFIEMKRDGVDGVTGLSGAVALAFSPDSTSLYAASQLENGIVVFSRDSITGKLTFVEQQKQYVNGVSGLQGVSSLVVSPDGLHLYAASGVDDSVVLFNRNPTTGALAFVEVKRDGLLGVDGLDGASSVISSADGSYIYVTGSLDNAITVFSRNSGTGKLTFLEQHRDGTNGVDGLQRAEQVVMSPDGQNIYVAASSDHAIAVFSRNHITGRLTFIEVKQDGVGGVDGLAHAGSLAVSPNGAFIYATSSSENALAIFQRNEAIGRLSFIEMKQDGVGGVDGLRTATDVAVSPDSLHVYTAGSTDDALAVFMVPPLNFSLASTATDLTPHPGDVVTFTIIVTNTGGLHATGSVISDTIPEDTTLSGPVVLDPPGVGLVGTPPLLASNVTLAPLQQVTLSVPVIINPALTTTVGITNTAAITSLEITTPVTDDVSLIVYGGPTIKVQKTANRPVANVGDTITYTYRIENIGAPTLNYISVLDDKLGSVTLESDSLASDDVVVSVLTYTVAETDLPGPITNEVIVTAQPPSDQPIVAAATASVDVVYVPQPADIWYAAPTGNDGNDCRLPETACKTISQAVNQASSGGVIIIAAGLYPERLTIAKNLTLQGTGTDRTIVDGSNSGSVFTIQGGTVVTINHIAIINGDDYYGGGINNRGQLVLNRALIKQNRVFWRGAGIYNVGTVILNDTTIENNAATDVNKGIGGGISNHSTGIMVLNNSRVLNNYAAEGFGGGISNQGDLTLNSSLVSGNSTPGYGAGIDNEDGGKLKLNNSTITGNYQAGWGGGVNNFGDMVAQNSTFSGNSGSHGGGIYNYNGTATLINCTVTNNNGSWGGGVYPGVGSEPMTLKNTIVANNSGSPYPDCYGHGLVSLGHNLIGNSNGCVFYDTTGDMVGTESNPINPQLGPLQDNGGATFTHAPLPGSPVIDMIPPLNCTDHLDEPVTTDQRGFSRPADGNGDGVAACDIGAYETILTEFPLIVEKTANTDTAHIGQIISYTYRIQNQGQADINDINATDDQLGVVSLSVTSLSPDQAVTAVLTHTVAEEDLPGPLINKVSVTGIINGVVLTGTSSAQVDLTFNPTITLTGLVNPAAANVGETITYTYRVTNTGDVSLSSIIATDNRLGPIILGKTSLAAGQMATGTITHLVIEADLPGPLMSTAIVTGTAFSQAVTAVVNTRVELNYKAGITMTVMAEPVAAEVGETITYTYRVTNTGKVGLINLNGADDRLGELPLEVTTLAPGQSTWGRLTHQVTEADLSGPFANRATITGTLSIDNRITVEASAQISVTLLSRQGDSEIYLPLIIKGN